MHGSIEGKVHLHVPLQIVHDRSGATNPLHSQRMICDVVGQHIPVAGRSFGTWAIGPKFGQHSREVAATPELYQAYIQQSRGEFSCAKRSCMRFQNAWVSDRTLCYLASGKPVVVQDTGPSAFLPNGEGMFRFRTPQQAAEAFEAINADYERHCRAARNLAETYFDARQAAEKILSHALKDVRAEVNA